VRESDLEFFFDPVCPFAWITSRWVTEVQAQRSYDVSWKFISLRMVNDDRGYGDVDERYKKLHDIGLQGLRIASAARTAAGNDAVAAVYTAIGSAAHSQGRRAEAEADSMKFYASVLGDAGLPREWADSGKDTFHDEVIRFETFQALERTGKNVGTPILTFNPRSEKPASLFGPVISRAPRGEEAVRLWDAVVVLAESGVAEIKRSLREPLQFD
jgi:protein-disulfide isomerase-like protein with CxxC motif